MEKYIKKTIKKFLKKYIKLVNSAMNEVGDDKRAAIDEFNEINRVITELLENN